MRKISIFTGTRADYSRLYSVAKAVKEHPDLELSIIAAGMHLIEKHGLTLDQIEADGFAVDRKVYTLIEGETLETMTKSVGLTVTEMATVLQNLKPDVLVVHGDRFEVMGAAIAGAMMNIPVAHIQGGEVTGSVDESLRHAITKLSHIHFPSNQDAADRLIRMGERPDTIQVVGCPMVDKLLARRKMTREEIFASPLISVEKDVIQYDPAEPYLLVMYHPVTSEVGKLYRQTAALLKAVERTGKQAIWLWPNADAGAREVVNAIKQEDSFFRDNSRVGFYRNLPVELFLSVLDHCSCLVGNSSTGMREACYFGTPVVNVGSRQTGRLRTSNILDMPHDEAAILHAITEQVAHGRYPIEPVYGEGNTGRKIAEHLATMVLPEPQKRLCY
ncbi:MAG: UDP-N-acetylglucosamine 2-epimerase [Desulfovibrionaceae bacterium]